MNEPYELIEDLLPAWMTTPDGEPLRVLIEIAWRWADPLAVELTFPTRGLDVVWLIGRDLLHDGLYTSAGEGDVCLYPAGENRIALNLSSPNGMAGFDLDADALREFLADTYDAVPAGEEMRWMPLDQELTDLLNGSEL